ncbi:Tim44 domain-containing protein [Shewanella putrefaciens]|uniref:TIM44-like domain-containing protein n=1 Tax=Shewanella putrefaciens TaxID=24 RepID=A0ABX8XBK6_SHEPU|nr:TIM44-like domain-containing protein [Shewanella putrefaciens]AVV84974.1 preprotein translocase subunit Tim44 [Shewanella putrefaciens]MCT8944446.1 TIM44-like domain-containing protein [Shewanella putrefaciens]QSE49102.1 TIM44-like domain-containing protein [Shewanella putrefaciens]QYX72510.1 TIM44-like domain-containing protein [Shewanella putrefaciens]GGN07651.1 preprotein translocase subunit Tim44 [Shewanella putrefaciens]
MKKLFIMLAMIFAVSLVTSPVVEAKKFGGSKSIGKNHQTAPAQPAATNTPTTAPAGAPGKKGMMGGMLGGLLAGGLLAALFMGEGFENIQFMDILIIGLLAFVLFKIVRTVMASKAGAQPRPAYAGAGQPNPNFQRQQAEQTGFASNATNNANSGSNGFAQAASDVPFNLPAGFDLPGFLEGARSHYKTLQLAWNENDLSKIQEYVSIELFNELSNQRRELVGDQHTEVMFLDAELVRATHTANLAEVSVKFSGRYRDTVEGVEEDIKEVWHLERNVAHANSPWLIVGIEQ